MENVLTDSQSKIFQKQGYIRFDLQSELADSGLLNHFDPLKQVFTDLPADPYARDTQRYRRYSRAVIIPWTHELHWLPNYHPRNGEPVCEYYQGAYNAEYQEEYRAFAPVPEAIKSNPLLQEMILYNFKLTFWDERILTMPIHVGVHFVKMSVDDPDSESVASPNHVHQDGEPFTFCHLIERSNVIGGINTIATPECAGKNREEIDPNLIHEEFELTSPLESYGICDRMVSHYVSGVRLGTDRDVAERSAILIDYVPTVISIT
ncbi:2OG-Fe dioxygenase family protein [Paludifilum halophilum]|uniref:2OG-Fe dioxygenase family protein n=1 Tax=Paludifilum halophilum TaxID=1642702 RepID=A0A235B471_9BACL|nr:2OG-Fe dioxygenase family protein [Paludifilum halophilum]OYD07022.1 hypothetical protein CHM34_13920 [Paludifilum halophilum]